MGRGGIAVPKPSVSSTVERRRRKKEQKKSENTRMAKVRTRDRSCRFPLCGCKKLGLRLHVSHSRHRGMGGNPKGDRSDPALMIYVCGPRHREHPISIDKGTLAWRSESDAGAEGPILWFVDQTALPPEARRVALHLPQLGHVFDLDGWVLIARETERGRCGALSIEQRALLTYLAEMTC